MSIPMDDPIRVFVPGVAKTERAVLRGKLTKLICDSLAEMEVIRLQALARFLDILKTDLGSYTPAERFIADLVWDHFWREGSGLTPEQAKDRLKAFRDDFVDAVELTRRFNRTYRGAVLLPEKRKPPTLKPSRSSGRKKVASL